MSGSPPPWRVGELADATGLTVRTLHHYDEIGLLTADRTPSGYRTYGRRHLERLYRINVLRQLGLPLARISAMLDDPAWSLDDTLRRHGEELERRMVRMERLRQGLGDARDAVARGSGSGDSAGAADVETCERLLAVLADMGIGETEPVRRTAVLVYADIDAAYRYLVDVFGLAPGGVTRDDDGVANHGEVRTGDGVVWLHRVAPEWGLASPATLGAATGILAVTVGDVDAHHARTAASGAPIDYPPTDQPYGVREYGARGPEGELWTFMTPLVAPLTEPRTPAPRVPA
ncbi:transcriptional regulator, MerR family [Beutenbergia cavernae DSM 12333]|uniref:Transcriptional regulator, MerR family n=1 Tax=Beutenbergia cavernae (strain ATCC BAA-8 / DSM 12333 / CCUG 43141 / JCM 11478 / NBRC 16432 / NCIMB 13614 / HKI 0122) TaxID=471853 RepID=C5C307_BEUC1|nr:MerR family transcriptional regulator [Beutenbergia cavernae]ACQ81851.1 transcriptional regulator, MerR family [Beutenbergia cavernae DSM 12333]